MRRLTFLWSLGLLFVRISMLAQIQPALMDGVNLRLLYVVGIPSLIGVVLCGGLQRSIHGRAAYAFLAFGAWIAIATPFSSWPGGSFTLWMTYLRTDFVMFFVVAGLALTWRECKLLMWTVAWAALVNLLSSRLFATDKFGYREGLQFGNISNPNDFAGHLIVVLPFILWAVFISRSFVVRLLGTGALAFGLKLILGTGSRGGLVAIVVAALFFLWRASTKQRIAFLMMAPVLGIAAAMFVAPEALNRISTFSDVSRAGDDVEAQEAIQSSVAREYVLKKSIEYMMGHPLLGVGPGQFASYEGKRNQIIGTHGYYHDTHNSYTQVASECGIPAAIFLIAGVFGSLGLLKRAGKLVSTLPGCEEIRQAILCLTLSTVGLMTAATFLSFGYFFYFPMLAGFATLLWSIAQAEFRARTAVPAGARGY
jgi:hypothetical protein